MLPCPMHTAVFEHLKQSDTRVGTKDQKPILIKKVGNYRVVNEDEAELSGDATHTSGSQDRRVLLANFSKCVSVGG